MEDRLEVELASALLEEVFETLAEQVHDHHVVHLSVVGLLVTDKVQEGHKSLTSHLVDELGLPKEHDVPLHFHSFFLKTGAWSIIKV